MITELLGIAKGLGGGGGGSPAAPISSGGSSNSATIPVQFGSRTLGTGAMGGDTTAQAGGSASGGSGGNSQTLWIVGILAGAAVVVALIFGMTRKK